MRKFWDHLDSCWNTETNRRPTAAQVLNFLEENGHRIAKPLLDLNIPALSHLREKPVVDLTGRVSKISTRQLAEGRHSNVWQGTLDDGQLVSE
jgi:hypothetical protein